MEKLSEIIGGILRGIWVLIEVFVMALAIFVVVYIFLFQPHQVKGNSMYPAFHDGELILTDKVSYKLHAPRRGDVVVFKSPKDEEVDFIKRVIGLPGEKVKILQGSVFVDGVRLNESYLPSDYYTAPGLFMPEGQEVFVPEGQVLVLGDNRNHSSDSREWGPVGYSNIVGKSFFRYWPFPSRFGLLSGIDY